MKRLPLGIKNNRLRKILKGVTSDDCICRDVLFQYVIPGPHRGKTPLDKFYTAFHSSGRTRAAIALEMRLHICFSSKGLAPLAHYHGLTFEVETNQRIVGSVYYPDLSQPPEIKYLLPVASPFD